MSAQCRLLARRTQNIIIGGGVYGAAVAWELARRGAPVRLLEGKAVAAGASGGPGRRGVRANGRDPRELPLIRRAFELWPTLHEELGVAAPLFERTGQVQLIEQERDLAPAQARVRLQTALGIACELREGAQVRDLEPGVAEDVRAALYCPGDGVADHTATTRAYAAAARRGGAVIEEGAAVASIMIEGGRAAAITTAAGETIPVPGNLLVLANAGVADLLAPYITLPVWNLALQVLLTKPIPGGAPVRHLVGHAHRRLALKAEGGNRVMISGGRLAHWNEARGAGDMIKAEIEANVADAVAVYPALAGIEIETADAGHLEAISIDGIPVIDRLPGAENVLYATAWCGHGWAIAPAVARLIAEWALEGERPALLAPFARERFGV